MSLPYSSIPKTWKTSCKFEKLPKIAFKHPILVSLICYGYMESTPSKSSLFPLATLTAPSKKENTKPARERHHHHLEEEEKRQRPNPVHSLRDRAFPASPPPPGRFGRGRVAGFGADPGLLWRRRSGRRWRPRPSWRTC
jgi:hypothetical protein